HIGDVFASEVVIYSPAERGRLAPRAGRAPVGEVDANERAVSEWVFEHGQVAGMGSDTLPGARALYLPLAGSRGTIGVLGVQPAATQDFAAPEQLHLLETFAAQTALAIELAQLAEEAQQGQVHPESERLRNSLLSALSHPLRTPLA